MQQYKKLEKQTLTVSEIEQLGFRTAYIVSKFKCSIFPVDRTFLVDKDFEKMNKIISGEEFLPLFTCYKIPLFEDKSFENLNDGYIFSDTKDGVIEKTQKYIVEQIRSYIEYIVEHNQYINDMPFIKRKLLSAYHKKDSATITSDNNHCIELANNYIEKITEKVSVSEGNKECEFDLPVGFSELFKLKEIFFINFSLNYSELGLKRSEVSEVIINYQPYNVFDFEQKNTPVEIMIRFVLSDFPDLDFNISKRNSEDYFSFTSLPGISHPIFNKEDAKDEIRETISTFVNSIDSLI